MKSISVSLSQQGFRVFPVRQNSKKPHEGWQNAASTNSDYVGKLYDAAPNANIGIATGQGLLVLDLDMKNGKKGLASLDALQHEFGQLPDTRAARTPSGGIHLYFSYDPAKHHRIGNRANIRDGVDSRGDGGYVLAPGSKLENGVYAWHNSHTIAPAPIWLIDLVARKELKNDKGSTVSDTIPQIRDAMKFLQNQAPAIEGRGGDHHTFVTAARLKEFGLSQQSALDLLFSDWNQRCEPPWDYDELEIKVRNAFQYSENAQGSANPEIMFEDDDTVRRANAEKAAGADVSARESFKAIAPSPVKNFAPSLLPPRNWVLGNIALEGKITVLISPGGVGKSTLTLNAALAVATGRQDIMQMRVRAPKGEKPAGAWVFNNEDDEEELHRRIYAAMKHHDIQPTDLQDDISHAPRLFINSGEHRPFMVAKRVTVGAHGFAHIPADADAAIAHIKANNIKLFVVDPFVETHEADENDNVQIAAVGRIYRRIAQEGDCAVILVHHTRKEPAASSEGHAGNADSGRGAGALMALARIGVTFYGMSDKDAKLYKVPDNERWRYVRLDDAKANLTPMRGDAGARWFKRESVDLETAARGEDGAALCESVGALTALPGLPGGLDVDGGGGDDLAAKVVELLTALECELPVSEIVETLRETELAFANVPADTLRRKIGRKFPEGETRMECGGAVHCRIITYETGRVRVLKWVQNDTL